MAVLSYRVEGSGASEFLDLFVFFSRRVDGIGALIYSLFFFFFFSSRRRHTRCSRDWSSDVCSSDLSYAIDWQLGGAAWWFHGVNVAWHAGASVAVAWLARRWSGERAALAAGLLFAVHPIHVEAVANIVGRAELMAALFAIVAGYAALVPDRLLWSAGALAAGSSCFRSSCASIIRPPSAPSSRLRSTTASHSGSCALPPGARCCGSPGDVDAGSRRSGSAGSRSPSFRYRTSSSPSECSWRSGRCTCHPPNSRSRRGTGPKSTRRR